MHKDFILWPTLTVFSLYVRQTPDGLELPLLPLIQEKELETGPPPNQDGAAPRKE